MFLNLFTLSSQAISEDGKFTLIYFAIIPYILITKEGVSHNFFNSLFRIVPFAKMYACYLAPLFVYTALMGHQKINFLCVCGTYCAFTGNKNA